MGFGVRVDVRFRFVQVPSYNIWMETQVGWMETQVGWMETEIGEIETQTE